MLNRGFRKKKRIFSPQQHWQRCLSALKRFENQSVRSVVINDMLQIDIGMVLHKKALVFFSE